MVTLMMSWRLNKSSSKVERRKRSWDKDEKIKWNYFIDSLDQFYSPGDFMRYPVIVHNYLLPLEQLFLSQPALHLQHAIQLISLSYSSFEAWQHGNISFFTALPLLLFPVNFPWQKHCPVQSQVCNLWMVWGWAGPCSVLWWASQHQHVTDGVRLTGDFNQNVWTKHSFTGCLSVFWWIF